MDTGRGMLSILQVIFGAVREDSKHTFPSLNFSGGGGHKWQEQHRQLGGGGRI